MNDPDAQVAKPRVDASRSEEPADSVPKPPTFSMYPYAIAMAIESLCGLRTSGFGFNEVETEILALSKRLREFNPTQTEPSP